MVLARLGSLAGFAFPIGSPRKGTGTALEGMELDGGLDNSDGERGASPFNEGYGTRRTLPRDLSLKSGLCFEAARPFDWSRAVPAHLEAEGMMQHLREAAGVAKAKDEEQEQGEGGPRTRDEALAAWVAASYYYTHPADRLPAPQHLPLQQVRRQMEGAFAPRDAPPVAASAWQPQGGEGGGGEAAQPAAVKALYRRLREWEEAFRHLYGLYRHDLTLAASFYMVAPDFTVAWTRDEQPRKTKKTTTEGEDDKSMKTLTAEVEALLSQDEDEEEGQGEGSSRSTSGEEEEDEEDEEAGPRLKAVISTSKRWLRERLRAAGIPFTMPLAPDAAARDTDEGPAKDVREELDALRRQDWGVGGHGTVQLEIIDRRRRPKANAGGGGSGEVPRHRSQLVVSGALAVHGLFTFLADLAHSLAPSAVGDVPRLLALKPFAHGTLGRLQVAANTPVQRTLLEAAAGGGGMETVYQLRLRGPVLPSQLRRLAGVVHYFNNTAEAAKGAGAGAVPKGAMAEGDWSLTMEVAPGTEAFNNGGWQGEEGEEAMSMKEVRYHAEKGRYVTIRMTAPSPSSSSSSSRLR